MIELATHVEPDEVLARLEQYSREEAEKLLAEARAYFERFPEQIGVDGVEHSTGATKERMAKVYLETADLARQVMLQHRRQMTRAMNPYFADLTDEQIDKMLWEQEHWDLVMQREKDQVKLELEAPVDEESETED